MNVGARGYALGLGGALLALITNCSTPSDSPRPTAGVDAGPSRRPDAGGSGGSNECGGTQTLTGKLGDPCGPCGVDKLECSGDNTLTCSGQTTSCWIQAAAGGTHTCGIRGDGSLWCWGEATNGRLGNGSSTGNQNKPVRVQASNDSDTPWSDWTAVAAGGSHTCGLRADSTMWCWGSGANGRRGDGVETATRDTPVQVLADGATSGGTTWKDWKAIGAGVGHTCGLRGNGSAWCWGSGTSGQLGNGSTADDRATPAQVLAVTGTDTPWTDWSLVAVGSTHTCGHRPAGSLWCWGSGADGRRGDGIDNAAAGGRRSRPVQVLASGQVEGGTSWTDWKTVVSGDAHSCGLRNDGTVWCWGVGQYGRLGNANGDAGEVALAPVQVLASGASAGTTSWNDWVSLVASSGTYTCGIRTDGSLWCWGGGGNGKLGNGNVGPDQLTPVRVLAADASQGGQAWSDWKSVVAGVAHTCGIRTDGSLWCWGRGSSGERGDGTTETSRGTPVKVLDPQ